MIKTEKLDTTFSLMNGVRIDTLDHEILHALMDINTRNINIGVESADPEVLNLSNKGITVEAAEACIQLLKKHGYRKRMTIYMIVGLPLDTVEKSLRSIRWAKKQGVLSAWCLATPYPKTPMFDWINSHGRWLIDPRDYARYAGTYSKLTVMFETEDFTRTERLYAIKEAKKVGK